MEKARKKIRVCLIFVVTLAVAVGVIYYFRDVRGSEQVTDGTLVRIEQEVPESVSGESDNLYKIRQECRSYQTECDGRGYFSGRMQHSGYPC